MKHVPYMPILSFWNQVTRNHLPGHAYVNHLSHLLCPTPPFACPDFGTWDSGVYTYKSASSAAAVYYLYV